jgi:hypothetical protein
MNQSEFRFDGSDYIPSRDDARLSGQLLRVWECMKDEQWRTLREISNITGDPEASISAQLRHLRKPRFGGYDVKKEYVSNGLFKYKLLIQNEEESL